MSRARIGAALERYKVRSLPVKGKPRWAVFDGKTQATNAAGYDAALRSQRSLTIDLIEKIMGGNEC